MTVGYNDLMVFQIRHIQGDNSYLSPLNTYNLPPGESGVFRVIEIDWIQSYNNFTALWQNQDMAFSFLPEFDSTYNVTAHQNKMLPPTPAHNLERY